jgi:glycosyltransferase involved in cell wall biosynthesis
MISILLLNYNYGAFLPEALESIRAQTFQDYELIVGDDGSTDESLRILERYPDLVDHVVTGGNVGLGRNIVRSLRMCTREFLAITSADDRWLPNHLEVGIRALREHPEAALSYSALRSIDSDGAVVPVTPTRRAAEYPSGKIEPELLLPGQFIPTQATLFRRRVVEELGGFDPELMLLELDLILRIVAQHPVVFTGETTAEYRVHPESMSRVPRRMLAARLALYEKYFGPHDTPHKRRFVAAAFLKTAYRELVENPSRESVRSARRHIIKASRLDVRTVARPVHLAMFLASMFDAIYVFMYPRLRRWLDRSPLKIYLQWILGFRKGRLRFGRVP